MADNRDQEPPLSGMAGREVVAAWLVALFALALGLAYFGFRIDASRHAPEGVVKEWHQPADPPAFDEEAVDRSAAVIGDAPCRDAACAVAHGADPTEPAGSNPTVRRY